MPVTIKEAAKFVLGHSGSSSLTPKQLRDVLEQAARLYWDEHRAHLMTDDIKTIDPLIEHFGNDEPIIREAFILTRNWSAIDEQKEELIGREEPINHINPLSDEAKALLAALEDFRNGALTTTEKA